MKYIIGSTMRWIYMTKSLFFESLDLSFSWTQSDRVSKVYHSILIWNECVNRCMINVKYWLRCHCCLFTLCPVRQWLHIHVLVFSFTFFIFLPSLSFHSPFMSLLWSFLEWCMCQRMTAFNFNPHWIQHSSRL